MTVLQSDPIIEIQIDTQQLPYSSVIVSHTCRTKCICPVAARMLACIVLEMETKTLLCILFLISLLQMQLLDFLTVSPNSTLVGLQSLTQRFETSFISL